MRERERMRRKKQKEKEEMVKDASASKMVNLKGVNG